MRRSKANGKRNLPDKLFAGEEGCDARSATAPKDNPADLRPLVSRFGADRYSSPPPSLAPPCASRERGQYDARSYRAMATLAIRKRETEWVVRVLVLMVSACLPMLAGGSDDVRKAFVLGAGLWFVLTIPANAYLAAVEPPKPHDGDNVFWGRRVAA